MMDAKKFFELSAGKWRSLRTTHHLAFRRAELGESVIEVKDISPESPDVLEICQLHQIDPQQAVSAALVTWEASMAWDKDDENHSGSTLMVIVPNPDNPREGQLLRERGYAEIAPVAGQFQMDEKEGMVLITEYETMSSIERFWFPSPNIRMRTSTVKRFGGFSTASFCTESRIESDPSLGNQLDAVSSSTPQAHSGHQFYSVLGW